MDDYSDGDGDVKTTSNVAPGVPNQEAATPAPPARGGTLRFRGLALGIIGQLYPNARFEVHRIGYPRDSDFSSKGSELAAMSVAIDNEAMFRITMTQYDRPTHVEGPLVWSRKYMAPHALKPDEYGNILKLGQPGLGNILLFTYCTNENNSWGLLRQVPGRDYTLEEAFNTLRIPQEFRREMRGFGAKRWIVGNEMPKMYICKDLPLQNVVTKINNVMRSPIRGRRQ